MDITPPRTSRRRRRRRRRRIYVRVRGPRHVVVALAAEQRPGYDADSPEGSDDDVSDGRARLECNVVAEGEDQPAIRSAGRSDGSLEVDPVAAQVPFDSPVLEQAPELEQVLRDLSDSDALAVRAVVGLVPLLAGGGVDEVSQVGVEQWVGIVARQTRMDRRLLLRLCRRLSRYPRLLAGAKAGRVSFAQLRGIWLQIRDVNSALDPIIDARVGGVLDQLDDTTDPDVLVAQVEQALVEATPQRLAAKERAATGGRFLYLQPTLDGTGGRISGVLDAEGMAILDDVTAPRSNQLRAQRSVGQVRADNLLERLTHSCITTDCTRHNDSGSADENRVAGVAGDATGLDAGSGGDDDGDDRDGVLEGHVPLSRADGSLPVPRLLVRLDAATLFDRDRLPAAVLTNLIGGRLWMTSDKARRLIDERGAELRTVVVDDTGSVVGVGRSARIAPGWLDEATLALHDTCTAPLCDRPAVGAQSDHATPWWPTSRDGPYGRTDVDELGPLCAKTNRDKESGGWRASQTGNGIRRWMHPATGLEVTTVPATWKPTGLDPPSEPPDRGHERSVSSSDPPDPPELDLDQHATETGTDPPDPPGATGGGPDEAAATDEPEEDSVEDDDVPF